MSQVSTLQFQSLEPSPLSYMPVFGKRNDLMEKCCIVRVWIIREEAKMLYVKDVRFRFYQAGRFSNYFLENVG